MYSVEKINAPPPDIFGCSPNNKAGRFTCDTCDKRFKKPCLLRRHGVVHLATKPFECSECRKQFTQSSSLQRHYAAQHNSNSKRYQCFKCPLRFSQRGNLQVHDKKVHPEINGKTKSFNYRCDRCASVYSTKQKLSRHINTVHSDKALEVTNLDTQDDLALTQSVLEQLKIFQREMKALEMPTAEYPANVEKSIDNDSTYIIKKDALLLQKKVDETLISEVQLRDRLNVQGTECYLRVQRSFRAGECYSYVCEFCSKKFRKSYNFLRHRRKHTRESPYKCAFCQSTFSTKTKLYEHMKIHRLDEHTGVFTKHYCCAVCGKSFSALKLLDSHMNTHAQTFMVQYRCKTCEGTFNTSTGLSSHKHAIVDEDLKFVQQLLPTPIKVYGNASAADNAKATKFERHTQIRENTPKCKCVTCGRLFSNSSVLGNHRRVYHGAYSRKRRVSVSNVIRCFKCAYCARFFKNNTHCKTHMLTHLKRLLYTGTTSNKQVEPCDEVNALAIVVDRATTSTIRIVQFNVMLPKNRIKQENVSKRRWQMKVLNKCHICSSQFRKLCDLKRHLVTHTGERLHECPTCGKCFSLSCTLKQHELTHVPDRQKHVCIVCGKSYSAKKTLNVHLRLHTGVQPFDCEHCELKFRTSGQRIAHLKVVHGLQKYTE